MKALIKVLNWIEWISALIGVVFILFAGIGFIFKIPILGYKDVLSFLIAANTFFMLTIVLFLFIHLGQFKKE